MWPRRSWLSHRRRRKRSRRSRKALAGFPHLAKSASHFPPRSVAGPAARARHELFRQSRRWARRAITLQAWAGSGVLRVAAPRSSASASGRSGSTPRTRLRAGWKNTTRRRSPRRRRPRASPGACTGGDGGRAESVSARDCPSDTARMAVSVGSKHERLCAESRAGGGSSASLRTLARCRAAREFSGDGMGR